MQPMHGPLELPAAGHVRQQHRVRLVLEILRAYVPLAAQVRRNDLRGMVREARDVRRSGAISDAVVARETAIRLGKIVTRTLRALPTDQRCLIRSLVLLRLLERRGIGASIVLGVRTDVGFGAHAWVEYDGRPVLPAQTFDKLLEL